MRRLIVFCVAGSVLAGVALYAVTYLYERPTSVRVAVTTGTDDYRLIASLAKAMADDRETVHFKLIPVADPSAASQALDQGRADLAVVRTDVAVPTKGSTVAILHRGAALFILPQGTTVEALGDLSGQRIGVLHALPGAPGNDILLRTILSQYEVLPDDVFVVPLAPGDVAAAVRDNRIDALFAVGVPSGGIVGQAVNDVAKGGNGAPKLLGVGEAKAMAQASPTLETVTISRGAYGGSVPRPTEELETLGVSTRLLARNSLRDGLVGEITRIIFAERPIVAASLPAANWMEAPSTDKGIALAAHSGAAAYLDGEQETFMEKYGDYIYIGAMVLSVFGSGGAALIGRLNVEHHARVDGLLQRLLGILREARDAATHERLDQLEQEADSIFIEALSAGSIRFLDGHRVPALSAAMEQVRLAIRRQRGILADAGAVLRFEPRAIASSE
jgi:TRAP transporter TAXI family solute receptor